MNGLRHFQHRPMSSLYQLLSNPAPFGSSWERWGGKRCGLGCALAAIALLAHQPVSAQEGRKRDSVGEDAVDAATQPLSDLNVRQKKIPQILLIAQAQPYATAATPDCTSLNVEIARLNEVLGPDADEPPDSEGVVNRGLRFGGDVLGGFIPFRGVIRRLSGARAEEQKWASAIYAGITRRSFLKGYAKGLDCASPQQTVVKSAKEILGISEN